MEALKNTFDRAWAEAHARVLHQHFPAADPALFVDQLFSINWEALEMKQRIRRTSGKLHDFLPENYAESLDILRKMQLTLAEIMPQKLGLEYMVFTDFIEVYGPADYENSVRAIPFFTEYFSAEFAVRPFILAFPEKMMPQMLTWAGAESEKLRRLASEGCRPRLPWGAGIPFLKKNPAPIFPILEKLKNDPSETVRRSVANNWNDISKDHPEKVREFVRQNIGKNENSDRLCKHAARTLLKRSDPETLQLFGFLPAEKLVLESFEIISPEVRIGGELVFNFRLQTGPKSLLLRSEYAIIYAKAGGKTSRKVFKISEKELSGLFEHQGRQSFRQMTTRKHYPGRHEIELIFNGKVLVKKTFEVLPAEN